MKSSLLRKLISFAVIVIFMFSLIQSGITTPVEAAASSVKIEGEKAALASGAIKGSRYKGYTGTGYAYFPTGKIKAKSTFYVGVKGKSNYDVTLRYSNGNKATKPILIYLNKVYFKTISLAPTSSFSKWKTLVNTLGLKAGTNTISFMSKDKTSVNIDYISCLAVKTSDVSMNFSTKYQTIEGFGGFGGNDGSATFSTQKYIDDTYDDLGATIYRGMVENDFQKTNDGSSADTINQSTFNTQGSFKTWLEYFKAIKAKGPSKFFLTIWSPPAWMKSNNDLVNGGTLLPQYYQHFAKYCAAYVKFMKEGGIDIYAFNIQNEPVFAEPYVSCIYTYEEYAQVNAIVAARFKKEGLNVKMLGPEDVQDVGRISQYIFNIDQLGTMNSLGIIAVHGYGSDGVNPSDVVNFWNSSYALARDFNKPLWMTETSGYLNDWNSCLRLGKDMQLALSEGRINAWVWWRISEGSHSARTEAEGLYNDFVPTPKYFVSKNFYKYIRPGAVRYACSSKYPDLYVTAYKHSGSKKLTIVLVNESGLSRTISIGAINGGVTPKQFSAYRTSATENCVDVGLVNSASMVIPPSSVTTLQASY